MVRMVNLFYRIVKCGFGANKKELEQDLQAFQSAEKKQITPLITITGFAKLCVSSLLMIGLMLTITESAAAQIKTKTITSPSGASVEISEWDDGLRPHKYLVRKTGDPNSRQFWYSSTGSANSGANEAGRPTSVQEWCRVRYLYGDDVRTVTQCMGSFMYSSHLITGIDGMHYELWFSPGSLSYFKIRNQETGVWYAHDGSANDGRFRTTKEDWCRVIFYHMSGILKSPNECKELNDKFVSGIAGTSNLADRLKELAYMDSILGKGMPLGLKLGGTVVGAGVETGFEKLAEGSIKNLNYERGAGIFKNTGTGASALKGIGGGIVVGIAVDYGVDAIKKAAKLEAKDANAGMIAAEVVTTTVATTAITTAIMTAAGASFNPVVMGVGFLAAGGMAAGEEIAKASKDTGIQFVNIGNSRYNRDLNGIGPEIFAQNNPPNTFDWIECGKENERCAFDGLRSVKYGAGENVVEQTFVNGVDCNNTVFGKDPAPNVAKICVVQTYPADRFYLVKQANNPAIYFQKRPTDKNQKPQESYCILQNMGIVNAYGLVPRIVPALNLKGTNEDMCAVPNGFYKLDKNPTVYRAYGSGITLINGRVVGDKFCAIPSLEMLNSLGGGGSVGVLPPGSDITRYRKDVGVCTDPEK